MGLGISSSGPEAKTTQTAPKAKKTETPTLRTSEITLFSHTHGRERRAERGIERKELQEAIKYGTLQLVDNFEKSDRYC